MKRVRVYEMQNTPSVAEYVWALRALGERVTDVHRTLFRVHFQAPDRTATAKQIASWAGIPGGWSTVNSRYGKLGHAVCDQLGISPQLRPNDTYRWWSVWSRGWKTPGGFVWQMLPQVAEALEELGWVSTSDFVLPDEVPPTLSLVEGAACQITINAYERNPEARRQCIKFYGATCFICRFNFGAAYGPDAEGYIHVHHLKPLSEVGGEYVIDPVKDLRPVCPNCHGVLHLGGKYRTIDEVSQLMLQQKYRRKLMDGYGDYTAERDSLIGSMTLDEILSQIKSRSEADDVPPHDG